MGFPRRRNSDFFRVNYQEGGGTIFALAHELQMDVVAEEIEGEEQARLLDNIGCEFGQGYYFGSPVPPAKPNYC